MKKLFSMDQEHWEKIKRLIRGFKTDFIPEIACSGSETFILKVH